MTSSFLHELLHAPVINGFQSLDPNRFNDVDGDDSYGPVNAAALASNDRELAFRNIENIVWYCIAMYYSDWDWSTLRAEELTANGQTGQPGNTPPAL